jgi:hypothetical protein
MTACFECCGRGWVGKMPTRVPVPRGYEHIELLPDCRQICDRCAGTGREREPMPGEEPGFLRRLMRR